MSHLQEVFISYGRADSKDFARKLHDLLVQQGLSVWFDFEDIPLAVDYQNQIDDGIERSDNFLFIISPHAVNSPYCGKEIELALRRHKRIIPLLHVEQISRETWQQRFPQRSDADWQTYTAKGLHSSFVNMHPEIAKINWVYFREGIDDFETAFAGLLHIFDRERDYVRQHTRLLTKALAWERNQQQSSHLLIGAERQQAQAWLSIRFQNEQPPCTPTDLHCEFITESLKNADNWMTQVFLAWAEEDRNIMEPIQQALMRQGLTVWMSKTDIKTGTDFQTEINRGIEEADNLVYLMSPDSLRSHYCQQEVRYALSLNKRVLPLMIRPTDLEQIPAEVRSLEFINFTDNSTPAHYQRDIDALIRVLRQDAAYYEQHKRLLTKALKWQRQQQNPTMLLRGYNLSQAESWFEVARHREQHPSTPLIEQFIQESLRQPSGVALDVFVSYSRQDSELARRLNDALQIHGKTTWFDQESIAAGTADFQREIYRGIESSNHFLFIISPSSIASPYCADEVEYATRLNKRIITLLYQPVDAASLPPGLASVQWLDFSYCLHDFDSRFGLLLRILNNDPEYLQTHTWLLLRSLEWDAKNRDEGLLLRGSTLAEIRDWLLSSEGTQPEPTALQRNYVTAANEAEIQRQRSKLRLQRVGLAAVSLFSLVALGLGLVAFKQYRQAERLRLRAQSDSILAQTRTSEALFQSDRVLDSMLEAMQAGISLKHNPQTDPGLRAAVVTALQQSVFWVREQQRINAHDGIIWAVSVSPDSQLIASASADGTVKLWQREGGLIRTLAHHRDRQMLAVTFAPDGKHLAAADSAGKITIWQLETGTALSVTGHADPIHSLAYSPDGQLLASASEDGTLRLWNPQGKLLKTLQGHNATVRSVAFSPDGQLIASASDDRTVRLWQRDGTPLKTLVGHTAQVRSVSFSPDGQRLVSGSWDETIRLWARDGTSLQTLRGQRTLIHAVQFSPDGNAIAAAGWDKTIQLWTLDGSALITTLAGHSGQVRSIDFSPADNSIISAGGDRTIRRWQLRRPLLLTLQEHHAKVYSVEVSPDGQRIASAGADNTVRLWDRQGHALRQLSGHQSVVWSARFSPDGQQVISASSDYTVKLWNLAGTLLHTLVGHTGPVYFARFSPDGKLIASSSADKTVRLWKPDGTLIRTLRDFKQDVLTVQFSRDSQTLITSGWSNDVQLWSLTGKLLATLRGHKGWVYDVSFSHDGKQILTGSYDNTAKLWTADGKLITTLVGHEDGVSAVDFSYDDRFLATASYDYTVKLWQRDGTLITTLRGHTDRVNDVNFSSDGKLLTTASEDQTVLLWNLDFQGDLDHLLHDSCQWTQNYLHIHTEIKRWQPIRQFCKNQLRAAFHPPVSSLFPPTPVFRLPPQPVHLLRESQDG